MDALGGDRNYLEILYQNRYVYAFCRYFYYFFGINLLNHHAITLESRNLDGQLSVEEQFNDFLNKEEYDLALEIALENNLSTDLVYQLQWTNKPITIESIQDYLANVANKSWVLEECRTKLSQDFESMHALLDHGLHITDLNEIFNFNPDDVNVDDLQDLEYDDYQIKVESRISEKREQFILKSIDNLTSTQRHFIINRQILLNYKEKLEIFEKISQIERDKHLDDDYDDESIKFDYEKFERIRNESYLEMAINYAHENNWKAIRLLFTFVGDSTLRHRLPILNNFPETLSPSNYQKLLPACLNDEQRTVAEWPETKLTDKQDWCVIYCQDIQNEILLKGEEYELNFYLNNPDYIEYKTRELNCDLLENWYQRRAREIEDLSSLVNNSLTFLSIGLKNNVPNLEQLQKEMEIYRMIVYDCLPRYNLGDISFSDYEKYSINKKIDLLMCGATNKKENFVECFQLFLLPFLEKTFEPTSQEYFDHMHNYLLNAAKLDLQFIYQIFKHYSDLNLEVNKSNDFILEQKQIFNNLETMIKLAIDCIYSNSEPNQLEVADNILKCLPNFDKTIHNDLVLLENNLTVANFLSIFNYQVCVSFVKELQDNKDNQELMRIFKTVIKTAIQRLPAQASVFHLQEILNDLLEIRKLAFESIVQEIEINSLFVQSLLMSGKQEIFNLVRELMRINYEEKFVESESDDLSQDETVTFKFNLPIENYLNLIHDCAVDYVNSADSVKDNLIEVGRNCLKLAPESSESKLITEELNFIQALQILNQEFHLHLLPVQIRLFPEPKIDIIIIALKSFPKSYKKVNTLLKLGELFQVYAGKDKIFRESKILSLIGEFAIKNQDYKECYFICKIIMDKEYQLGWEICRKLASIKEFTDKEAKYKLLSYALSYCADDGNEISCIVDEIKNLKINLNENTTKKSLPDLIINKTQDVSGLILNTTQDVAQVTSHLTKWLIKNVIKEDDSVRIARQYENIDKEYELESKNKLIMNSLNIPSFYSDAFENYSNFKIKNNDLDIDYKRYSLPEIKSSLQPFSVGQMLLRTHLLKFDLFEQQIKSNEATSTTNLLQELAYFALFHDTSLALNYLKCLNDYELTEKVFNQLSTKSPILVYIALYFYSIELCLKLQPKFDLDNFSIKDTIFKAEAYLIAGKQVNNLDTLIEKYRKLFNDLMKADSLLSFYPEIDVNRFVNDEQYKKDTLLGLAMTEDDQTLENVKNMAIQYNVSLFEVYMSYLENLLTFSSMEANEIDKKVFENIELMSALIERNDEVTNIFTERIYPLISGCDYDKFILYYKILERINNDNRDLKLEFVNHFKNLKKLKKCFVDTDNQVLDYKQLIEEKKSFVELLYPILNETNTLLLARWTITLKLDLKKENNQQKLNSSAVYSVWLRKKFLLNRPKWKDTYDESIETIKKLNANDYLHFINFFLLSPDSKNLMSDLNERFYYLESALEYSKKKNKGKKEEQEWFKVEEEIEKIIELIND